MGKLDSLKLQLKELAMATTQDEYLKFVYQPLMQANDEKLKVDIEKVEREHPELVKAIQNNWEQIVAQAQKERKM